MSRPPFAFRSVIRERHPSEECTLFWRWICAKHTNLKNKFIAMKEDTVEEEDQVDVHVIRMLKQYRLEKPKFVKDSKDFDDFTVVNNNKKKDKGKGKGKSDSTRPQGSGHNNDINKGKGKGKSTFLPGNMNNNNNTTNGKGMGKGKGAAFPGTPWTETHAPVQAGFFLDDGKTPIVFMHSDDYTQNVEGVIFFGDLCWRYIS